MIAINKILDKTKGDRWIWLIIILLSLISILTVYSATGTYAYKVGKTVEKVLLTKHLIFVIMGIGMISVAHLLDYKYHDSIVVLYDNIRGEH
jgi:cell division protein FtsW